ncbi:MAG TPA: tetratricopeptide repeat protein [Gemmatimonadaceae bacterium]|nr:tetratricopeptide repeat protein [Gemmatimonadaceae bacterium]
MAPTHFLEVFGGLSLRDRDGPVVGRVSQRRRLALLAVLAAEHRSVSRDKLLGLFWPDVEDERARHLLADTLYVIRSALGQESIVTIGDDVANNEDRVESDVGAFVDAIKRGELARAVDLYRGPFLDGILLPDAPEFERWADATRLRLAGEHKRALERLAIDAGQHGDDRRAAEWWRTLAVADPVSSSAALGLMRSLVRAGDRGAALQFARVHEDIMRAELDVPPDPAIAQLVAELRTTPAPPAADSVSRSPQRDTVLAPLSVSLSAASSTPGPIPEIEPPKPWWMAWPGALATIVVATVMAVAAVVAVRAREDVRGHQRATDVAGEPVPQRASRSPSIAVLPFEAVLAGDSLASFADGITDALIGGLDRLRSFHVIAPTSAAAVKRMRLPARAAGDTLGARYLVDGTVGRAGRDVHVAARLTDTRAGTLLWSRDFSFAFSAAAMLSVEDTIVYAIGNAVDAGRGRGAGVPLIASRPPNTEAYVAYLMGRHLWNSRNPAEIERSVAYFKEAIDKDSMFALPYVGLADSYASFGIGNMGDFRATEYFPIARHAAQHALSLDSTLAEAHATLGYIHLLYDLDWERARRELSLAVAVRPSYTTGWIYQTILFEWTAHFEAALSRAQYAATLDPISPLVSNIELGRALFYSQMYDSAAAVFRATLAIDSMSLRGRMHLGQVYVQQKRFDEAIRELERAARLSPNTSRPLALLAYADGAAGHRAAALTLLDTLRKRARHRYVPAFDFAIVHAGLGNSTDMFAWLDSAVADHSIRPYLMDPTFAPFRDDPRYQSLLKRLDLPWPKP